MATVLAGLMVTATNFLLTRTVVGVPVQAVSRQMRHVSSVIAEATYSGDWSACSPEECQLLVDSDDALGEAAASFNGLLHNLAASVYVQQAMSDHARRLGEHLELAPFSQALLDSLLRVGGADAGAVCVIRDGELEIGARHRLEADELLTNSTFGASFERAMPLWIEPSSDIAIDPALVSFRPAAVLRQPLIFRGTAIGMVVLAFSQIPSGETKQLLDALGASSGVALNNALAHERFQRLAALDSLTGAYNRRFGLGRLTEERARAVRSGTPLGLLTFDLDHFKEVNDTHGHQVGDRALRDAVAAARVALREGDVLVRTGGEEFLVILPGAGQEDLETVGERIRCPAHPPLTPATGPATRPVSQLDAPGSSGAIQEW